MKNRYLPMISLPPALLALIAITASNAYAEPQWPYELPAHVKYFPEDEPLVKRGLSAMEELSRRRPVGVQKMTDDESEMFFLDYWQFEEEGDQQRTIARRSTPAQYDNETSHDKLLPPFLVHSDSPAQSNLQGRMSFLARSNIFNKRDYMCPNGTYSCYSINSPYSCCATGEVCVSVTDTGLGNVGCCPEGETCNGQVAECDTSEGYTSCPGYSGGGCCIPNYECSGIGCAINGTTTVTTTAPVVTVTSCPSSMYSCAASLGGGCCKNGADCGTSNSCLTSSKTTSTQSTITTSSSSSGNAAGAPARVTGTSDSGEATTPRTTTVGTEIIAVCPTNYYFCSAYYRPGCCRIGRDCSLTNCPTATASSTFISDGVTVVVPEGGLTAGETYVTTALITGVQNDAVTTTLRTGSCQSGWLSCAQSVGGGCCPPEYGCGAVCSATGPGYTGVVAKVEPGAGVRSGVDRLVLVWAVSLSVCGLALFSL